MAALVGAVETVRDKVDTLSTLSLLSLKHDGVSTLVAVSLYTSDAADEEDSGALGGRRILYKNQ